MDPIKQCWQWAEQSLAGETISDDDAMRVLDPKHCDLIHVLGAAFQVRQHHFAKRVKVHRLNNVQNGLCPEDCGYCGQAKSSETEIRSYPLKTSQSMIEGARQAKAEGASRYCMVLSGRGPSQKTVDQMCEVISTIRNEVGIDTCLSSGLLKEGMADQLKTAGLGRLNHNLNTSERHYPEICSTHTFQDRWQTLMQARQAGLEVCSGLIIGMGEQAQDVVSVARQLRDLEAASIPVNFLIPMDGNPVKDNGSLTPEHCLRVLCLFRFLNPKADLRAAAGREGHLRQLQVMALYPANSLFSGGYLLTKGQEADPTIKMILDAGFEVEGLSNQEQQDLAPAGFQLDQGLEFKEEVRSV